MQLLAATGTRRTALARAVRRPGGFPTCVAARMGRWCGRSRHSIFQTCAAVAATARNAKVVAFGLMEGPLCRAAERGVVHDAAGVPRARRRRPLPRRPPAAAGPARQRPARRRVQEVEDTLLRHRRPRVGTVEGAHAREHALLQPWVMVCAGLLALQVAQAVRELGKIWEIHHAVRIVRPAQSPVPVSTRAGVRPSRGSWRRAGGGGVASAAPLGLERAAQPPHCLHGLHRAEQQQERSDHVGRPRAAALAVDHDLAPEPDQTWGVSAEAWARAVRCCASRGWSGGPRMSQRTCLRRSSWIQSIVA